LANREQSFPSTGDIAGHCTYGHLYQPTAVLPYLTATSSKIYWTGHFTAAPGYAVRTLLGGINEHSSCPMSTSSEWEGGGNLGWSTISHPSTVLSATLAIVPLMNSEFVPPLLKLVIVSLSGAL